MATKRNSLRNLAFGVILALSLVMASTVISATPEPTVNQPNVAVTAPNNTPETKETKVLPASDQKSSEDSSKNEKTDKKKGPITGMLLGLFGAIAGHQGATR